MLILLLLVISITIAILNCFYKKTPRKLNKLILSSATVFYLIRLLGITGIFKILNIITFLITIFKQISSINKNQTSQRYPNKEKMSTQEAHAILGVSSSASREEIVKAYKSLMLKNHPDHGGSQYIATKIIEAKHILLNNN